MKQVLIVAIAGIVMAACAAGTGDDIGNEEARFRVDCLQVMTDPDAAPLMAELETDSDGICSCMSGLVASANDQQKLQFYAAFDAIAVEMQNSGKPVEDIINAFEDGEIDPALDETRKQTLLAGLQLTARSFERLETEFAEGGNCSAS